MYCCAKCMHDIVVSLYLCMLSGHASCLFLEHSVIYVCFIISVYIVVNIDYTEFLCGVNSQVWAIIVVSGTIPHNPVRSTIVIETLALYTLLNSFPQISQNNNFMHSAHTTFVYRIDLSHSIHSSGARLGRLAHMHVEPPLAMYREWCLWPRALHGQVDVSWIFAQD